MNEKPRHRSGYTSEETELVRSACLTVAVTLGAYLDDVVIVSRVCTIGRRKVALRHRVLSRLRRSVAEP